MPSAARRRYAEGTTVSAEKSQTDIRALLRAHGADAFGFFEDSDGAHIQFGLRGTRYRFSVDRPDVAPRGSRNSVNWLDGEWRRRWRARVLWLKATLEFADGDAGETRRALLAYAVLTDGATVEQAIDRGALPLLESGA